MIVIPEGAVGVEKPVWTINHVTGAPDRHEAMVYGMVAEYACDGFVWRQFGGWHVKEAEAWRAQRELNKELLAAARKEVARRSALDPPRA